MSELFVLLLNDESRWVRLSAYQELGKFIASFTHHKEQEEGLFYWLFAPNNENLDEENQDDKNEQFPDYVRNHSIENDEDKPLKRKRHKRKSKQLLQSTQVRFSIILSTAKG